PMSEQAHFVLRDAVHGDIHLARDEGRLLDTLEMQRLRGVKQLGLAHLVYPGATHSRFEHSIGTLHMTQLLIDAVNRNADLEGEACRRVSGDEARLLRAAALLHDVTHIPFGHNIEDQTGLLPRHDEAERFMQMLSEDGELGRELVKQGLHEGVLGVLGAGPSSGPPFLAQMISDTICSDLMDYLRRDAHGCGLNLHYDLRIADCFKVDAATGTLFVDCEKDGLIREDVLSEVLRMLQARYYFSERVYYHHAKIAAGAMVARVVETALGREWIRPEDLYMETDEGLLLRLEKVFAARSAEEAGEGLELLERLRRRRLLKRVAVFPFHLNAHVQEELIGRFFSPGSAERRRAWEGEREQEINERFDAPARVLLYCPGRRMQLKEVETCVRFPGAAVPMPLSRFRERLPRIADLESSYLRLWRFYVFTTAGDAERRSFLQERVREAMPGAVDGYRIRE
ncbi:MAG: HD domain-containing protein, partial [Planctomycetota bacterium]